jgi:WD40 repeat protein
MATITAEAKLYTGIRCWVVDKNTSAALTSSFSLGNKNRPASSGDTVFANVKVNKIMKFIADLEVIGSVSLVNERYKTYGAGNNVITAGSPRVINNTRNWRVNAAVVCKFPTYFRIDVEKLQLPEGTDCIVQLEEGWLLEGDYPGSFNSPTPRNDNFVQFRTPYYGLSFMNTAFSLPNTVLRIKQLASSVSSAASFTALPIFNPGRFAALFGGVSQIVPNAVKTASAGATLFSSFGPIDGAGGSVLATILKIKQLSSVTNSMAASLVVDFEIAILFESNMSANTEVQIPTVEIIKGLVNEVFASSTVMTVNAIKTTDIQKTLPSVATVTNTGRRIRFGTASITTTSSLTFITPLIFRSVLAIPHLTDSSGSQRVSLYLRTLNTMVEMSNGIATGLVAYRDVGWNSDGTLLAVAATQGIGLNILQRNPNNPNQFTTAAQINTGTLNDAQWSPDSRYLACAGTANGNFRIYERLSNTTYSQVFLNGAIIPNQGIRKIAWNPDGSSVAITLAIGSVRVFNIGTQVGTTLNISSIEPPAITADSGWGLAWNHDGTSLAVGHTFENNDTNRGLTVYNRSGNTFTKIFTPSVFGIVYDVAWNHDGTSLAVAHANQVVIYNRSGNTFSSVATITTQNGTATGLSWNFNGTSLAIKQEAGGGFDQALIYDRNGNSFTKLSLPQGWITNTGTADLVNGIQWGVRIK